MSIEIVTDVHSFSRNASSVSQDIVVPTNIGNALLIVFYSSIKADNSYTPVSFKLDSVNLNSRYQSAVFYNTFLSPVCFGSCGIKYLQLPPSGFHTITVQMSTWVHSMSLSAYLLKNASQKSEFRISGGIKVASEGGGPAGSTYQTTIYPLGEPSISLGNVMCTNGEEDNLNALYSCVEDYDQFSAFYDLGVSFGSEHIYKYNSDTHLIGFAKANYAAIMASFFGVNIVEDNATNKKYFIGRCF